MKVHSHLILFILFGLVATLCVWPAPAADDSKGSARPGDKPGAGEGKGASSPGKADSPQEEAAQEKGDAERARLEKKFRETLSNAVLSGRWRLVRDGKLGEEREEKYTLGSVNRLSGDLWIIQARVQYGKKDVTLPVPVNVKWAGDTPIISVTNVGLPGLGTYTARVMVYNELYTGTWFGPGYGGFLSGRVLRNAGNEKDEEGK